MGKGGGKHREETAGCPPLPPPRPMEDTSRDKLPAQRKDARDKDKERGYCSGLRPFLAARVQTCHWMWGLSCFLHQDGARVFQAERPQA